VQEKTAIDEFFERPLAKRFCWQIVIVCGFLTAIEAMDVYVLGVIVSPLSKGLGVSLATFGIVFTFQAVGQIAGTYILAPMADKYGRRPIILWCTLGFGILTVTSAFSQSLEVFIAQRMVAFLLIGGAVPNMFAIVSEYGSSKVKHRNTLIIGSFHGVGAGFAFLLGGVLIEYGWRIPLLVSGGLTLISLVVGYFFMPESIRFLMTREDKKEELKKLLIKIDPSADHQMLTSNLATSADVVDEPEKTVKVGVKTLFSTGLKPATLLLWVIGASTISLIGAVAQWTPTYLHNYGGLDLQQAAFMASISGPAGIFWPMALIWLMNKMGPTRAMSLNYLFAACALGSFAFISIFPSVGWLIAFGYGAFLGGATSGFYTLCTMVYPTEIRATGISWAVGAGRVFSLFVPILGGIAVASKISPIVVASILFTQLLTVMVATLYLGRQINKNTAMN
jgi:AAHS family 4-hydroxybenzoate transporter-like MFS transporter